MSQARNILQPILRGNNISGDLYVAALEAARSSGTRLFDPSFALAMDPNIGQKLRRDPIILQAFEFRLNAIAGKRWVFDPWSDRDEDIEVAAIFEVLFKHISEWRHVRKKAANAIIDARTFAFITGRRVMTRVDDEPPAAWWVPTKLKDMDPRRFRWRPLVAGGLESVLEIRDLIAHDWVPLDDRARAQIWSVTYEDFEGRLGYGRGLRDALYHFYWMKGIVLKEGLQGLERWAQGWPIYKIDTKRLAQGAPEGQQSTAKIKAAALKELKNFRAKEGGWVMDKEDELEISESGGTGHKMVMDFARYLDEGITRLVTGSLLPAGGGSDKGSLARSQTEENSTEQLIQFDRGVMDDAVNRDIVYLVWITNRENFARRGLGDAHPPVYRTVNEKRADPDKDVSIIDTALRAKIPLKKSEVYERIGMTEPGLDDEVFDGAELDVAVATGGGPFGGGL